MRNNPSYVPMFQDGGESSPIDQQADQQQQQQQQQPQGGGAGDEQQMVQQILQAIQQLSPQGQQMIMQALSGQ